MQIAGRPTRILNILGIRRDGCNLVSTGGTWPAVMATTLQLLPCSFQYGLLPVVPADSNRSMCSGLLAHATIRLAAQKAWLRGADMAVNAQRCWQGMRKKRFRDELPLSSLLCVRLT